MSKSLFKACLSEEVFLPLLWQGKRAHALTHLRSLRPSSGEMIPPLEDTIRSVHIHHDCLGAYEQWQADGYRVGSSLVERSVVLVNNALIKKRGMRWKRVNAPSVVALRVSFINAEWEAAA